MKYQKLEQMNRVTEARYLHEFQKVKGILDEESRLRNDLAKLKAQSDAGKLDTQENVSMQSVGADILWQGWVMRTRKQLNTELSQVMARKLNAMENVRKAFGRKHAVQTMCETIQNEQAKKRRKKAVEALIR